MKIINIEPITPNSNPFLFDIYNMGTQIGNNCMVMYDKFPGQRANYVIVVNIESGERIKVLLNE